MNLSWIDPYIDGVIEYCGSNDIYEIYKTLDINLKCIDKDVERQWKGNPFLNKFIPNKDLPFDYPLCSHF